MSNTNRGDASWFEIGLLLTIAVLGLLVAYGLSQRCYDNCIRKYGDTDEHQLLCETKCRVGR